MEMIMDVDSGMAAACGQIPKLKRKRSSEHLMLRKTVKNKVFLQDLQHNPANGSSSNGEMWPSEACDVNMNISDELSKMMSSKCMIAKGRWMMPQQCMIGKVNYKFAVIGYSYDLSDGCCVGSSAAELDKAGTIGMKESNDAGMMFGNSNATTGKCFALNTSKCVKKLFDEPNAQHIHGTWPSQRCSEPDQTEGYGVNASQHSDSKGHLNGNVSYSYRTHFFLNH